MAEIRVNERVREPGLFTYETFEMRVQDSTRCTTRHPGDDPDQIVEDGGTYR